MTLYLKYNIEFKPRAIKDLEDFPSRIQQLFLEGSKRWVII
jgi:mRNA-degrading endonuclease RelE of RelBE toxin-antitoxin system